MKTLESQLQSQRFIIKNFPLDNQRKLMKLKIFLNSNKFLSYAINNNLLTIDFSIEDKILIAREIEKIISFVETNFYVKVLLDNQAQDNLNENAKMISSFKDSYQKLKKLKELPIDENEDFKFYCSFCDATLFCKLRSYQYTASYYLTIGKGGFDFSVPGSGKTIISYAAYNYFRAKNICNYILIIGPINSFNAWQDEYVTCFGKNPNFISLASMSKNDARSYLLSSEKNHQEITFINIDKAWRMKNELISFLNRKSCLLIIDEAHKEKNPDAEITKTVMEITKFVKCRIILTGTPMPNGYEDLYSLFKIFSPYEKILPFNYSELRRLTIRGADETSQQKIMNSIKPVYSRVSKAYLLNTGELTAPNYKFIDCNLSKEQQDIYNFLQKMAFEIDNDFDSALNVCLMKAILIREMQVSANPGLLSKSIISTIDEYKKEYCEEFDDIDSEIEIFQKADNNIKKAIANSKIADLIYKFEAGFCEIPKNNAAVELALSLVAEGKKVILWDVFVQNMFALKNLIKKKSSLSIELINGLVTGDERQNALTRFKYGSSMILIANPATLAESISLHKACQNAIYVNRNFNAAQFIQSKDRIHRINMPLGSTATYYFLINKNTVDEEVNERLTLKENRMLKILDSEELMVGGAELENTTFISLDDLKAVFKRQVKI